MRQRLAALSLASVFAFGPALADASPPLPTQSPDAVLVFYPAAARAAGLEGAAVIHCVRNEHLALKGCALVSENPAGHGFGAAALAMAARSPDNPKLNLADEPGKPGQDITISFSLHPLSIGPDITSMAHTMEKPAVVTAPSFAQIQAAYPERAFANQVEGSAAIDCTVLADGKLTGCRVAGEAPTGFGFGQAAVDLAGDFVMKPRRIDGEAVGGPTVRVGIRFTALDPTAPLSLDTKPPPPH